jgi:hypothetical protein
MAMCSQLQQARKDIIAEGDMIWHEAYNGRGPNDTFYYMSSIVTNIRDPQSRQIAIAVMDPSCKVGIFGPDDEVSHQYVSITKIDFDIIPIKYWHKIYRVDELLNILGVNSFYELSAVMAHIESSDAIAEEHFDHIEEVLICYIMVRKYGGIWCASNHKFVDARYHITEKKHE